MMKNGKKTITIVKWIQMLLEQLLQKETLPEGEIPKESGPGDTSSLHSREADKNSQKEKTPEREEEEDMDSEDSDDTRSQY